MEDEDGGLQRSGEGPSTPRHSWETLGQDFRFPAAECAVCLKGDFFFLSHKSTIQMLRTVPAFNTLLTSPSTNSNCDFSGYVKM